MPRLSRGLLYVNSTTGICNWPRRLASRSSTRLGVVPAARAREAACWITGPSAKGSL